jgi:MFS transporter, OPA family, solute carrier family 37 (glycerol-3-phosphate transporter), member 3
MSVVGFFIGGVANMISAAITADLGGQGPIQGNKDALSTVTGIVDGTGSVGAAIGQILVPIIQEKLSWVYVFYFFIVLVSY